MAVVGVDIGDHSTHISVAGLGAVETISNDYCLRATPSIVAFGERQRFMGVAAENQRAINPRATISSFKNTLGRAFPDFDTSQSSDGDMLQTIAKRCGAKLNRANDGRLVFEIQGKTYTSEEAMAMLFTKVRQLVAAATTEDETDSRTSPSTTQSSMAIDTCVVSVPIYFSQAQRVALTDAARIAGLHVNEVITDTSALCFSYGKNKMEQLMASTTIADQPQQSATTGRNVVLLDVGHHGTQAVLAAFTAASSGGNGATCRVLASSHSQQVGGKDFDVVLLKHALNTIQQKYGKSVSEENVRAHRKLATAMERAKKQMSANTSPIPVQIDALVDDTDVQFNVDRAKFEELVRECGIHCELRATLENLLAATTVRPTDIHSVEIVGGTSRIPLVKQTVKEVFGGVSISTTLNADEAVSGGCALHAAALSNKFVTRPFVVDDCVHHGVEAMIVLQGQAGNDGASGGHHEKMLVCDEGDSVSDQKIVEIALPTPSTSNTTFPLNIAMQYVDTTPFYTKLMALYKVDQPFSDQQQSARENNSIYQQRQLCLTFSYDRLGCLGLREVCLVTQEDEDRPKRRRTSEQEGDMVGDNDEAMPSYHHNRSPNTIPLSFSCSMMPLVASSGSITESAAAEANMVAADAAEISRQEEKNRLEEQLYAYRHQLTNNNNDDMIASEAAHTNLLGHLDEVEAWLYEEGEEAPTTTYQQLMTTLQSKMKIYSVWMDKFKQKRQREEEKRQFVENQAAAAAANTQHKQSSRQIPVVYEGSDAYVPRQQSPAQRSNNSGGVIGQPQQQHPTRMAHKRDPFPREPFPRIGRTPFFESFGW